ncbi:hypothetical protein OEA41_002980 [Lepraria neglecta]|uniref:Uncharacterized protein n=1 Tax=Lepraria neglecta TaxID=209136 RepID=A0AAD9Z3T6_9LECA|nr:hypothetical protein OEA41_002980 [Lepraria neglecta]
MDPAVNMFGLLHLLWETFGSIRSDVSGWVNTIVDQFLIPTIQQKREAIVTAAFSIVGVLVFLFIFLDAATAGSGTAFAVGAIVGITNAVGAASNFANGFLSSKPDDTHLSFTSKYDQGVTEYISYIQDFTAALWAPSDPSQFGTDVVTNFMKGALWIGVPDPFNVPHLGDLAKTFDTLPIVFVPYGTVTDFMQKASSTPGTTQFAQDECNQHWVSDPKRPNYISCDLSYGGQVGMTVITQPAIADGGTLPSSKAALGEPDISFKFAVDDLLQSSLTANAQHGFNWNFTTDQLYSLLQAGTAKLANDFTDIPPNTPDLYNLDVCVVTEMSYVSGARQYLLSHHKGPGLIIHIFI